MQPTAEGIESTLRTAQQLQERGKLLLEQFERRNVDLKKLSADYQAALKRMDEVINSPKATEKIVGQCLAALEELRTDMQKAQSILDEASALASARASEGPATKPSRHRGTRV